MTRLQSTRYLSADFLTNPSEPEAFVSWGRANPIHATQSTNPGYRSRRPRLRHIAEAFVQPTTDGIRSYVTYETVSTYCLHNTAPQLQRYCYYCCCCCCYHNTVHLSPSPSPSPSCLLHPTPISSHLYKPSFRTIVRYCLLLRYPTLHSLLFSEKTTQPRTRVPAATRITKVAPPLSPPRYHNTTTTELTQPVIFHAVMTYILSPFAQKQNYYCCNSSST